MNIFYLNSVPEKFNDLPPPITAFISLKTNNLLYLLICKFVSTFYSESMHKQLCNKIDRHQTLHIWYLNWKKLFWIKKSVQFDSLYADIGYLKYSKNKNSSRYHQCVLLQTARNQSSEEKNLQRTISFQFGILCNGFIAVSFPLILVIPIISLGSQPPYIALLLPKIMYIKFI